MISKPTFRTVGLPLFALCLSSTNAYAQGDLPPPDNPNGRLRSSSYATPQKSCEKWDVGFTYTSCVLSEYPGSEAEYVQIYTEPNGNRQSFISDPKASQKSKPLPPPTIKADQTGAQNHPPVVAPQPQAAPQQTTQAQKTSSAGRLKSTIITQPGRAELLYVAVGHLNRLETPFLYPAVKTSGSASALNISFEGRFAYVSVTEPVTLYLHESGLPDPAIAVSLIPKQIAPRQVNLKIPARGMKALQAYQAKYNQPTPAAKARVQEMPRGVSTRPSSSGVYGASYISQLSQILHEFGNGGIPKGWRKSIIGGFPIADHCKKVPGVTFSFANGQAYKNRDYIVLIGRASANTRKKLNEVWCASHPATAAVAFYPRTVVSKGKPTEFMIVLRRETSSGKNSNQRKRLAK